MVKKIYVIISIILLSVAGVVIYGQDVKGSSNQVSLDANNVPIINARACVLMDADTGQVLYSKNPHAQLPMASTTKIMTVILAVEHLNLDDTLTASKDVEYTPDSSIYMANGEHISVVDALAGAIIKSGNDTCVLFAENIAGSEDKFVRMMNDKAKELGCKNTHFVNSHGLYAKDHYSSAYDLCLMAKEALNYPIIFEIAQKKSWVLKSRSIRKQNVLLKNKHRFMNEYPYATGLKSGYVKQSGRCYVGTAEKDGRTLISCVLNCSNSTESTIALMNYGFNSFNKEILLKGSDFRKTIEVDNSDDMLQLEMPNDLYVLKKSVKDLKGYTYKIVYNNGGDIKAPVHAGDKIARAVVYSGKAEIASVDILAKNNAELPEPWISDAVVKNLKITLIILLLVVIIFYGRKIAKNYGKKRNRVKKKMRRTHISRPSHSRRYKSYPRSESRPGDK